MPSVTIPVAEVFVSPQGEGSYSGQLMNFIRLAGCNVGKAVTPEMPSALRVLHASHPSHTVCTSGFGQSFLCDTDYRKKMELTESGLYALCNLKHACITGGEPFMHSQPVWDLLSRLPFRDECTTEMLHVETSGTVPIKPKIGELMRDIEARKRIWITCSPKQGFIPENAQYVSEWKFVVDFANTSTTFFDELRSQMLMYQSYGYPVPAYIQPVNPVHNLSSRGYLRALAFIRESPEYRLSLQLHKILNVP